MITISPIKNSANAAAYYAKEDNYYLSEVDAKEASLWLGIGADKLGLSGKKTEEKDLQKLLEGKLPNGVTIGLQKDGSIKHRAGYDLCFHAPKSVSILALDGGDKRFYDAHLEAVKETLKAIEEDCAQARIYNGKKISFENTKNLTVALVKHTASRALDPHLHHHALVMNVTERQDKTWRALASNITKGSDTVNGFSERIYKNQIYYGLIYQLTLANKVVEMGCVIENVGQNGLWEIKGIPKEARDTVSKRRKQIEARMESLHYHSKKAADIASLATRENKQNISLKEMKQTWKAELARVGFSSEEFLAELEKNKNKNLTENSQKSKDAILAIKTVKDATWHLSQYKIKLDYVKIISQAMEFAIGKTTHRDIVQAANQLIKEDFLISLNKSDTTFVTKELIETEKAIMDFVDRGKNQWSDFIKDTGHDAIYTEAEKHAIDILQSKHRLNLVESNTDNKDLIEAILNLAESSGKTVRVLSPNRLMANDINENITRRKPDSLWQWLISLGRPEIGESVFGFKHKYKEEIDLPKFLLRFKLGKDVILINNTEALGCNDTKTLIELTEKSQAKVIFLQDTTDKRSRSGNLIETLKQAGIKRFKFEAPVLEKLPATLKTMPELKIIKENNKRTIQLAKEYAQKSDDGNTIVLVGSKKQLKSTNEAIRKELKEQNKLTGLERDIPVLNPVYMSKPEAVLAHKYQQNMVIRFYNGVSDDWSVSHCDRETNTLKLAKGKRRMVLDFKKHQDIKYGVFKKESLQIAKGDKLIASSNMYNLGIKNGEKFTVSDINEKHIKLDINTKAVRLSLAELKGSHFQYDYATTINRSSKKPADNIITDLKAYLLDKPTIDELTKRAKNTLTIFTNDGETAQKRFGSIPVRLTATETLLDTSKTISGADDKPEKISSDKTISEIKSNIEKAIEVLRDQYAFRSQDERKAVDFAIEKITSRNAGFDNKDLEKEAFEFALKELISKQNKEVTKDDIKKIIEEKRATGELVMGKHFDDGAKWTTKEILEIELSIIADLKKGANKLEPLLDPKTLKIPTEEINLTKDQKNAISLITTTKDQYVIVQGYAGTGKTAMFSQIHKMLKEENNAQGKIKMLGLAPTHKAIKELKAIGIKAQSLKSFLIAQKRIDDPKINILDNRLIVLDEISMVPNKELLDFVRITGKSKAHAVLSGDRDQHLPISSGKPIDIAQKSNILKIAFLKEIVRQRNPNLKKAVQSTINKNYAYALDKIEQENPQNHIERINPSLIKDQNNLDFEFFKNLQKSIIEIDNNKLQPEEKTLEQMVAEDFLTRTPEVRDKTVVIVHANEDRAVITEHIRDGLKKQGVIEKTGVKVNCLTAKGFTDAEHKSLRPYSTGDVIKLRDKYYHVMVIDVEAKSLLLKDGSGQTRYFYPEKEVDRCNMELYHHTKEELAIGDVIRLTKTDKKRSLFANFEYQVKEINDKQAILESKDKEKSQIILKHRKLKDSHWDYAQTVTSYGIQGGSKKYAISFEVSYRKFLANVRSFYISVSRAIEHLTIYTDNKSRFLQRLFQNKGDKYSALEVTGELDKLANNSEQTTKLNAAIYRAKEIKQSLENQAENIVERLLGSPNNKLSSSKEWRYGTKGSFVVGMAGNKRGLWKNFETGESGNLLTLIQKNQCLSFPETLKYASDMFGGFIPPSKINKDQIDKATKASFEKNKTSEYAQKLAKESLPISGTVVEKYLTKHRSIKNIDSEDIRYHPKVFTGKNEKQKYLPAMLSIGKNRDGNIQCVQATYLDPKTANKADIAIKKRTYASPSGALVSLQKHNNKINPENKISFIAEGAETGLSIKDATENIKNSEVVVTLGKSNFTTIDPKSIGDKIVFCLDNDGPATFTDNTIHKAAKRLIDFGKEIFISIPGQAIGKSDAKIDFNDMAKTTGIEAVKSTLDNSVPYNKWRNNIEKIATTQKNEINLSVTEKVMQDRYLLNNKLYNSLLKKPEINLSAAIKLVDLEQKNTLTKYYTQNTPVIQKTINSDISKSLSKTEKEIY
ncbi:MAG: conjugative transfer relaxase/helicase TraI [bacterium]